MIKRSIRLVGISVLMLLAAMIGLRFGSVHVSADAIIYNGSAPRYTTPVTYDYQPGLQRGAYIAINGEPSNYGGTSRQTLIDARKWNAAGRPDISAHLYLKNNNPIGGESISLGQLLRFPKDFN